MIRILLVTDEPILAAGLTDLASGKGLSVSVWDNQTDLIQTVKAVSPNILLLDMAALVTFEHIIELQQELVGCRIVLWVRTMPVEAVLQAMEHGICGIVRRSAPAETLFTCLQIVSEGGLWFDETLRPKVAGRLIPRLTGRESELICMLRLGMRNKEIAAQLNLTEATVKVYLSKLYRKLRVRDRFELTLYALHNLAEGAGDFESITCVADFTQKYAPMQASSLPWSTIRQTSEAHPTALHSGAV
jgi:two-component system nitrate/nitrite response regulator NarL